MRVSAQPDGPFRNREQLKQVPGLGETTSCKLLGFLKITNGDNPLDAIWIHPESYELADKVLEEAGCNVEDLRTVSVASDPAASSSELREVSVDGDAEAAVLDGEVTPSVDQPSPPSGEAAAERRRMLCEKVQQLDVAALAERWSVNEILLQDILHSLAPGRDPREDLPAPVFRRGIVKLEDLELGMNLSGTVLNVVDFGAFVDIGLSDSGLVHISRLADRFVRDPHEIVGVGDVPRYGLWK